MRSIKKNQPLLEISSTARYCLFPFKSYARHNKFARARSTKNTPFIKPHHRRGVFFFFFLFSRCIFTTSEGVARSTRRSAATPRAATPAPGESAVKYATPRALAERRRIKRNTELPSCIRQRRGCCICARARRLVTVGGATPPALSSP